MKAAILADNPDRKIKKIGPSIEELEAEASKPSKLDKKTMIATNAYEIRQSGPVFTSFLTRFRSVAGMTSN
jgi:hypothetical protein